MFCPNCGAKVEDDSKFCENCGASLNETREDLGARDAVAGNVTGKDGKGQDEGSIFCPNCGAKVDKDTFYCENCGQRIYEARMSDFEENDVSQEEPLQDTKKQGFFHTATGQVVIGVIAGCVVLAIIIGIYNFSRPGTEEVVTEEPVTEEPVAEEPVAEEQDTVIADNTAGDVEQSGEDIKEVGPAMITELPEDETITPVEEEVDYLVPDADTRYYSESELSGLDKDQLRIARNEIYARHGRRFKDSELQEYFDGKDWYNGTIAPDDFDDDSQFNKYEKANIELIKSLEG